MEFIELAKRRHSVRKYKDVAVEPEKVDMILEAGRIAPTAANRQPIRIYAVQSKEGLDIVSKAANFFGAPLVFVICGDKKTAWQRSYDGMIATDIDA
ncbi:MAG: nitroreductase family protein, partial [Clostridiales bacterium]|nr:nitroreductase family protein [Clostridiales bacterium]